MFESPTDVGVVSCRRARPETPMRNNPLTDAELNHLGEFLADCAGGDAMNVEELDGFFAALVASPDVVLPSEYLPEVFGRSEERRVGKECRSRWSPAA